MVEEAKIIKARSRAIFASWPVICIILAILIIIKLPEILNRTIGREVIIPILSELTLENRIGIIFSLAILVYSSLQYSINRTLLRIEQKRLEPSIYSSLSNRKGETMIFVGNGGGGPAWDCEFTLCRCDSDLKKEEHSEMIYPQSGVDIELPEEWKGDEFFDMCIIVRYHVEEGGSPNSKREWIRAFNNFTPWDYSDVCKRNL